MQQCILCCHQVVGIETEKVSKEKAVADEEEQKVAAIAVMVSSKQRDCEEDLAKAEPALLAAQDALNTLNKVSQTLLSVLLTCPISVSIKMSFPFESIIFLFLGYLVFSLRSVFLSFSRIDKILSVP